MLVQLQISSFQVAEELVSIEFVLVENLAEFIGFALLRRILLNKEKDDRLPDVLGTSLVLFTHFLE